MNKHELAKAFSVSLTTVDDWLIKGLPYKTKGKKGKSYEFDLSECISWHKKKFLSDADTGISEEGIPSIGVSHARYEHFRALKSKIDYEKKIGELVSAKHVHDAAFETATRVKEALLNIPDRLAALLAAETDRHKVHELLTNEIDIALENLSKN